MEENDVRGEGMMRIVSTFPYIYIFTWIFLSFLPFVYYSTKVYIVLLFFLAFAALGYTFYFVANYKLILFFKCTFVFVGILFIYGLGHYLVADDIFWPAGKIFVETNRYLLWLLISMLSVVPIYIFTCRGELTEKGMKILFFIMLVSSIYAFHISQQQMMIQAELLQTGEEEFTITVVYYFLSVLPLVILFKKNILLQFILFSVFFAFFILSAKRGTILLGSICILFMMWGLFSEYSIKKKILFIIVSSTFLLGLYEFTLYHFQNSPYFAIRYQDTLNGYSSQRGLLASSILEYMDNNFSIKSFLFGIGAQNTLNVTFSFAHNDWIAIFLEQGVLGLLAYALFWVSFIYTWIKLRYNRDAFIVVGSLIIIGLGKSIFSMFYLPVTEIMIVSSGFYSIALGYFLGKNFCLEHR